MALQNYEFAINSLKGNSSGDKVAKTFLQFWEITSETVQNFQNQKEITKIAIDALYREIMELVKDGVLIPYSYQLPRNLSDLPIRVPIDIFMTGNINWTNSELIYKNSEFTGVRLIEPIKKLTEIPIGEINNQNNSKEEKSFKENPRNNLGISFANLDSELHIDEKRAAEYLGISPRTLQGYRTKGGGPEFIKISHKVVRYKIADLIK